MMIIFLKRTYHGLLRLRWTSLHLLLLLLVLLMVWLLLWLLRLGALTHISTYLVHVDRLLSDSINTLILLPLITTLIKVTAVHIIMVLSLVMLMLITMTTSLVVHPTTAAMVSIVLVMMAAVTMMLLVHHIWTSTTVLATAHVLHVLTTTTSVTPMSTVSVHMTAAPTSRAVLFSSSWRHFLQHYQR